LLKLRAAGLGLAGIVLAVAATAQTPPSHPPVEAFGTLPVISHPSLSPDGKYFAAIQMRKNRATTLIYQTDAPAGTLPIEIPTGDLITAGITWTNNDRLIIVLKNNYRVKDYEKAEGRVSTFYRSIAIGADGSNPVVLLNNMKGMHVNPSTANIVGFDAKDPNHLYLGFFYPHTVVLSTEGSKFANDENPYHFDLVKVDVNTGDGEVVAEGEHGVKLETAQWVMDGQGSVVARVDATRGPLEEHLYLKRNGSFVKAGTFDANGFKDLSVYGIAPDGSGLIVLREDVNDFDTLEKIDFATGALTPFYSVPGHDINAAPVDRDTGRVMGAGYTDDTDHMQYFDPILQSLQTGLEKAFPGRSVHVVSKSRDVSRVIAAVSGPRLPPVYYYVNQTTHQAFSIGTSYPGLTEAGLGEVKAYPYKARDGLDIHAYLTLPTGKTPKNLPTVIMPHGGPNVEGDGLRFDWWAQFLANRGYAVLQPNFRGSRGYGKAFLHAGTRQWGLTMQDDLTDGVEKLVADGVADPKRICIVGASYGGYAALAGATYTPDLYRCAFAWAPVSDLPWLLRTNNPHNTPGTKATSVQTEQVGNVSDDFERLAATSPDRHADQVKCPVLIMHGERDTTVDIDQSEREVTALQKARKQVEFIRISGNEDHHLNFPESRINMLTVLERFLKANIGE
jgi:dipeptidyl aminopeptidase/acylaminoacyl peptidase